MSDEQAFESDNFASMFAASQGADEDKRLSKGDTVKGTIVLIDKEFAFIDYGGKGEALLAREELLDENGELCMQVGDSIEAAVLRFKDGSPRLSRSLHLSQKDREAVASAFEMGIPVEGRVSGRNKGGFEVSVAGLRGFCPISQIDAHFVEEPDEYIGRSFSFIITEYKEGGKQLVLSRRKLLEEEREERAEETRATLAPGSEFEGTVTNLRPFGAFVDIGGIEGMVHVSELSHRRVEDPAELLAKGQQVRVKVLSLEKDSKGRDRIALSMKAFEEDPWEHAMRTLREGETVTGRVSRLANFGAFVELVPGVDGLVHISELSERHVGHPREVISEGAEVEVKVLEMDWTHQRISLSMRQVGEEQLDTEELREGSVVSGTVHRIKPFGLLVKLGRQYGDKVGLVPIEDTGVAGIGELKKRYPEGQEISVAVATIDRERERVRFSLSQLDEMQAQQEFATFQDKQGQGGSLGTFGDLLAAKLGR